MDCDGHGTSVSAIIAGPQGIAPDAKIVAIKVFPQCSGSGFSSDIIAGVDFAITNRQRFNISALNMSLGGDVGLGSDLGFCDALVPEQAVALDAAAAAGLAVFVASGNEAHSNGLSAPACLSSAVSVGAVHSTRQTTVDWGGFCTDAKIEPDNVVCFSNSTTRTVALHGNVLDVIKGGGGANASRHLRVEPCGCGVFALLREARPPARRGAVGICARPAHRGDHANEWSLRAWLPVGLRAPRPRSRTSARAVAPGRKRLARGDRCRFGVHGRPRSVVAGRRSIIRPSQLVCRPRAPTDERGAP